MNPHISEQFDADLKGARQLMMQMGGLVEHQVEASVRAFVTHDAALAAEVLTRELEVNRLEVALDDSCVRTLALRQPAAQDLRLLISLMKAGTDLERAGDEAVRIARMANEVSLLTAPSRGYPRLQHMGELTAAMVRDVLDAFARTSADAAQAVMDSDARVDKLFKKIEMALPTRIQSDPAKSKSAICAAWAARSLERIGDHAKNVGEHVVFLVEGTDVRHTG